MLVNVQKGELFASLARLQVRPLQHNDQPLLLLLGNLERLDVDQIKRKENLLKGNSTEP